MKKSAVFINYVNGVHQNSSEQQRRIVSHASKQKQSKRTIASIPPRKKSQSSSNRQTALSASSAKDTPERDGCLRQAGDWWSYGIATVVPDQWSVSLPTKDRILSGNGLDPFDTLPIPVAAGVTHILEYRMPFLSMRAQGSCSPNEVVHD